MVVPAGSFMMGSPPGEEGRFDEEGPQHRVTIARPFAAGKLEVTFAQRDACVAAGGCTDRPRDYYGRGRGNRPVIEVSWNDITKESLPWLTRKSGKTYRLLTEAEWEYAARGVTSASAPSKRYWWGDQASHEHANCGKDECCDGLAQGRTGGWRPRRSASSRSIRSGCTTCTATWRSGCRTAGTRTTAARLRTARRGNRGLQSPRHARRLLGQQSGVPPLGRTRQVLRQRPVHQRRAPYREDALVYSLAH